MPLQPDDEICFCFHVTLRKIVNYCRIEKPRFASQISQCLSAGTGCGWCRPMLRKIHKEICNVEEPWWRKGDAEEAYHSAERDAAADQLEHNAYAAGRKRYLKDTGAKPPDDSSG
jgi:NAD(P)H-nitrite reductase large subunit